MSDSYNEAIELFMRDVKAGSDKPVIIYRTNDEEWFCNYIQDEHGKTFSWVEAAQAMDSLAVVTTGKDFSNGSFTYVHDKVLRKRLYMEYTNTLEEADNGDVRALVFFLEDNMSALSSAMSKHMTWHDKPLAALYDAVPISLIYDGAYGWDKTQEAIEFIEDHIMSEDKAESEAILVPSKRIIDGYEEKQNIQIAGHLVILAENAKADEQYMVCFCKWDNPFGVSEYYNICKTGDYVEALRLYAGGIQSFVQILENERVGYDYPGITLTVADYCYQAGSSVT